LLYDRVCAHNTFAAQSENRAAVPRRGCSGAQLSYNVIPSDVINGSTSKEPQPSRSEGDPLRAKPHITHLGRR